MDPVASTSGRCGPPIYHTHQYLRPSFTNTGIPHAAGRRKLVRQPWRTLPLQLRGTWLRLAARGFDEPLVDEEQRFKVGGWLIRRIKDSEVPAVSAIQADCFGDPFDLPGIRDIQVQAFKAEVLGVLRRKLKLLPNESFACLVAEAPDGGVAGVVELSLEQDKRVCDVLGADKQTGYPYVSCMAVAPQHRRAGVASALLAVAEALTGRWKEERLALHVYRDNIPAVQLYSTRGYDVVDSDPEWKGRLPGGRVRLLLAKQLRRS